MLLKRENKKLTFTTLTADFIKKRIIAVSSDRVVVPLGKFYEFRASDPRRVKFKCDQ
jgi:hypothetical protein